MISASAETSHDSGILALDLTAMLDVIFMLLVFFILTANAVEHSLDLDLPTKGASQATPVEAKQRLNLTLIAANSQTADGAIWRIDKQPINDWQRVADALLEAQANKASVVIAGNRDIPMERLLEVLAELKRIGHADVQVLMQQPAAAHATTRGNDQTP